MKTSKVTLTLLFSGGIVFSILLAGVPVAFMNKDFLTRYIKDPFAAACLQTPVNWSGYEFLIGVFYIAAFVYSLNKIIKKSMSGFYTLFGSSAAVFFVFLIVIAPKIENYSQGPAIEFFQKHAGNDVYMTAAGYKSYAQYFYFKAPPGQNPASKDLTWLLEGNIDKPAYFVAKITKKSELEKYSGLKLIEEKGGYLLYQRQMTHD
jgi:hypothetical protein